MVRARFPEPSAWAAAVDPALETTVGHVLATLSAARAAVAMLAPAAGAAHVLIALPADAPTALRETVAACLHTANAAAGGCVLRPALDRGRHGIGAQRCDVTASRLGDRLRAQGPTPGARAAGG